MNVVSNRAIVAALGDGLIDNTAKGIAAAITTVLRYKSMLINETELARWAEFDYARRSGNGAIALKPQIKTVSLAPILKSYLRNWYGTHIKWLKAAGQAL